MASSEKRLDKVALQRDFAEILAKHNAPEGTTEPLAAYLMTAIELFMAASAQSISGSEIDWESLAAKGQREFEKYLDLSKKERAFS